MSVKISANSSEKAIKYVIKVSETVILVEDILSGAVCKKLFDITSEIYV